MTRRYRRLDEHELTALAQRLLSGWPPPTVPAIYVEIEKDDEPDEG
jgi:hypothetical protein